VNGFAIVNQFVSLTEFLLEIVSLIQSAIVCLSETQIGIEIETGFENTNVSATATDRRVQSSASLAKALQNPTGEACAVVAGSSSCGAVGAVVCSGGSYRSPLVDLAVVPGR